MNKHSRLRAGEWVEVRSKEEILATLDKDGQLDGLPFMPEMFEFCGQRLKVFKRAHKTCDPPNGLAARRMKVAVHLEGARCNGQAHGGCQAACLVFWKQLWLKPAGQQLTQIAESYAAPTCTEEAVRAAACNLVGESNPEDQIYACQSTRIPQATHPLHAWDFVNTSKIGLPATCLYWIFVRPCLPLCITGHPRPAWA